MKEKSSYLMAFFVGDIYTLKPRNHITFLLFWLKYTSSQYVSIMAKQTPRSFFHSAKKQEMKTFSNLIEKSNIGKWCSVWYVVVVYSRIWHTTNPDKMFIFVSIYITGYRYQLLNILIYLVLGWRIINFDFLILIFFDIIKALTMFPFSHSFDEILTVQNTIYVG